ncbi:SAM-dependent methyltransferase [Saccharothrix isguenensis]
MNLVPVGRVGSTRTEPAGRAHGWSRERAWIDLDVDRFGPEALVGLHEFSHLELVFLLDRVDPAEVVTSRRPASRPDQPEVGIFAQRFSARPNRIGLTRCRLTAVDGTRIHVEDCDAIDGTPVLDIKPWLAEYGPRGPVFQPGWATDLMVDYWT